MDVATRLDKLIQWLFKHAKATPTQALTFWFASALSLGTGVRYLIFAKARVVDGVVVPGWEPTWEWLLFLLGAWGVEAVRFLGKRNTEWKPEEVARARVIEKNGNNGVDLAGIGKATDDNERTDGS